ncbi:MAG: aldo/keto reductase, partial [Firmicutes bacterium]|nr:aldo/keto reductase [Bacillota bacterium]
MYRKPFKDKEISALGFGGLRFPMEENNPNRIDREKGQQLIDAAIVGGINFFDTAYTYQDGDSERFLGEALAKYPRDSYFLSTKFYADAGVTIEEAFETQLKRCQTEYFDFYLFHSLDENFINYFTDPQKDCLGYLLKQKEAG